MLRPREFLDEVVCESRRRAPAYNINGVGTGYSRSTVFKMGILYFAVGWRCQDRLGFETVHPSFMTEDLIASRPGHSPPVPAHCQDLRRFRARWVRSGQPPLREALPPRPSFRCAFGEGRALRLVVWCAVPTAVTVSQPPDEFLPDRPRFSGVNTPPALGAISSGRIGARDKIGTGKFQLRSVLWRASLLRPPSPAALRFSVVSFELGLEIGIRPGGIVQNTSNMSRTRLIVRKWRI